MSDRTGSLRRICSGRGVVGLAFVLVLAGCTGSGPPSEAPDANNGQEEPVVQPAEAAPSVGTEDQPSDAVDAETPSTGPRREPLADLGDGIYAVNVRTGAGVRLPKTFTSIRGADHYDVSPDGSMILFDNATHIAPSDEPADVGRHQLYVANADGSDLRRVTDDPLGASQGSWSPDGTKIVYLGGWAKLCCWNSPADLMVMDLASGTTTRVATGRARRFYNPMFSADGSAILITRYDHQDGDYDLWTIPVSGGQPRFLLEDRGYAAAYSPDGSAITFPRIVTWHRGNSFQDYSEIWISDADGSHARKLVRKGTSGGLWSPDGRLIFYYRWYGEPPPQKLWASLLDMRTGRSILLSAHVRGYDWLDDETLIVRSR